MLVTHSNTLHVEMSRGPTTHPTLLVTVRGKWRRNRKPYSYVQKCYVSLGQCKWHSESGEEDDLHEDRRFLRSFCFHTGLSLFLC